MVSEFLGLAIRCECYIPAEVWKLEDRAKGKIVVCSAVWCCGKQACRSFHALGKQWDKADKRKCSLSIVNTFQCWSALQAVSCSSYVTVVATQVCRQTLQEIINQLKGVQKRQSCFACVCIYISEEKQQLLWNGLAKLCHPIVAITAVLKQIRLVLKSNKLVWCSFLGCFVLPLNNMENKKRDYFWPTLWPRYDSWFYLVLLEFLLCYVESQSPLEIQSGIRRHDSAGAR